VAGSERQRELRRRRKRRASFQQFKVKLATATVSEKQAIAAKLRKMTPGAEDLITAWNLEER